MKEGLDPARPPSFQTVSRSKRLNSHSPAEIVIDILSSFAALSYGNAVILACWCYPWT